MAMYQAADWAAAGFKIAGLVPELALLALVQIVLRISNFSVAQPAREALYTVVPREVKYKSKSFIDTFVYRLGDSLGAWAVLGLLKLQIVLAGIALLMAPVATLWIYVGRMLGRRQRELTGRN
jgi:ATP:ADP antiporter, AAA family